MDLRAWRVNRGWVGWRVGQKGRRGLNTKRSKEREKGDAGREGRWGDLGLEVRSREKRRWEVAGGRLKGARYLGREGILVAAEVVRKRKMGPPRVEEGVVCP
jgi:hypothetical protein